MTSGSVAHRGVPVPRVDTGRRSSLTRRLAYAGTCTGAVAALVLGPAVAAFANAANPTKADAKVWDCGQQGAPVQCSSGAIVEVSGTWSWGELANQKSSPQKDCAGRYGVGWSVDWWGMSASKTASSIQGLEGSTISPATNNSAPGHTWGDLTPDGAWQVQGSNLFFHTSAPYNGFLADLCHNATPTSTGPVGDFSALAVYPSRSVIPPKICVNFYDPHGKEGQPSTSDGDNYATKDGDNSIKTNDFDPSTVSGNCLVPQNAPRASTPSSPPAPVVPPAPSTAPKPNRLDLAIVKTASASGVKTNDTLAYTLQVTNVSDQPTTGSVTVTDAIPGGLAIVGTPTGSGWNCAVAAAVVTCTLDQTPLAAGQPAAPITVTTTVLSSAASVLVNTGVVQTPGDVNPANNRSTVRTPVTQVLGTKIVKSPATPAKVAAARVNRGPSVLPFTGWNTSTAITLALALLVAGLRLINMAGRRKRA